MSIEVGKKYRVLIDWGSGNHRGKTVRVLSLQKNGLQLFARVAWVGKQGRALEKEYGTLFNVNELRSL